MATQISYQESKMKNLKAVSGILLVFILGLIAGSLITHTVEQTRYEKLARVDDAGRVNEIVNKLTKKLELDTSQQAEALLIVTEQRSLIQKIRNQKVEAEIEKGIARISKILRPEQQEKLKQIIAKRKARKSKEN